MNAKTIAHISFAALTLLVYLPQDLRACYSDSVKTTQNKIALDEKFNKADDFLIGFAKLDFVEERRNVDKEKTALIDQVVLHGLEYFPKKGRENSYFMGYVTLDTPITVLQYRALMNATEKHGNEQVYVKFSGSLTKEGKSIFKGKLLGYYVVTNEQRAGFLNQLGKNREAPGFVPFLKPAEPPLQPANKKEDQLKAETPVEIQAFKVFDAIASFPEILKEVQDPASLEIAEAKLNELLKQFGNEQAALLKLKVPDNEAHTKLKDKMKLKVSSFHKQMVAVKLGKMSSPREIASKIELMINKFEKAVEDGKATNKYFVLGEETQEK